MTDAVHSTLLAAAGEVAVWLLDLDASEAFEPQLATLSADERERARRFVFDVHRHRFIACRAALRALLAARLGTSPAAVAFDYGSSGRPALAGSDGPHFNVSHSDRFALIAIGDAVVGIDIERVRPLSDMERLAARVFSDGEQRALAAATLAGRADAFFGGWTRKEAYIKARGGSIGMLGAIEVSLPPDEPRLVRVAGQPHEPDRWHFKTLTAPPGFAAAICLEGSARTWHL